MNSKPRTPGPCPRSTPSSNGPCAQRVMCAAHDLPDNIDRRWSNGPCSTCSSSASWPLSWSSRLSPPGLGAAGTWKRGRSVPRRATATARREPRHPQRCRRTPKSEGETSAITARPPQAPLTSATEGSDFGLPPAGVNARRRTAAPRQGSRATGQRREASRSADPAGGTSLNCCPARPLPFFRGARVRRALRAAPPWRGAWFAAMAGAPELRRRPGPPLPRAHPLRRNMTEAAGQSSCPRRRRRARPGCGTEPTNRSPRRGAERTGQRERLQSCVL